MMSHQPYVEDAVEDSEYIPWGEYEGQTEDEKSPAEPLPEAPTPPPAVIEEHVNVWDYMVAKTPNASHTTLTQDQEHPAHEAGDDTSLVRYEYDAKKFLDPTSVDGAEPMVQYGTGPVLSSAFVTPGAKGSERRRSKDGETKKDKKRKRLHVDVPGDQVMTDAPPVLHSGLTGGLRGLMRSALPPSPDYSGGDNNDGSPASPLKKTKHSKHTKGGQISNSIFDMLTGGSKTKTKTKKSSSKEKKKSHRHHEEKEPKLLEYGSPSKVDDSNGQMILFKPRADVFLGFVNKGPDSDRGCSVNKALRRYHRERQACGSTMSRGKEEKELWRTLRLRKNDRGEIVVFGL